MYKEAPYFISHEWMLEYIYYDKKAVMNIHVYTLCACPMISLG